MKTIKGNLLDMFDDGDFDIIIHGCNCHKNMGGGIAAQIAKRYPLAEERDTNSPLKPLARLGTMMPVWLSNRWLRWFATPRLVINAYTQYHPGADGNLNAIRESFDDIAYYIYTRDLANMKIGIPAIGCGIAGLNWEDVEPVIEEMMVGLDVTLVVFE